MPSLSDDALTAAQRRAEQAEALNAELAAALRNVLEIESLCGDVGCAADGGHFPDCPVVPARAALARTPAAAAERVAAMEAVCEVLRAFVELRDHGPKGRGYVEALVDVTNRGRAALARLDALDAETP